MATAGTIINLALRETGVLGVGQTALAEDLNDSLALLNGMMAQWARRRWLVYHLVESECLGNGNINYSVGPGGDFSMARPDTIEAAFFRQNIQSTPNQVDYPLTPIRAREDYNQIALKSLASFPQVYFYDSGYPLGYLYVWPLPNNSYVIHITTKQTLPEFTSLTDEIVLPPEYFEALMHNLAARLKPMYGLPPDPSVTQLAKLSLNTIKNANAQIIQLQMPQDLVKGSNYNIYSDQSY